MIQVLIICGCIGHKICPESIVFPEIFTTADATPFFVAVILLFVGIVRLKLLNKGKLTSIYTYQMDVLLQPKSFTPEQSGRPPFSNFSPLKGYLALLSIIVIFLFLAVIYH